MARGDLIRRVITASEILKVSDEEMEKTYKRQVVNMQGNAIGSMNAFIKKFLAKYEDILIWEQLRNYFYPKKSF